MLSTTLETPGTYFIIGQLNAAQRQSGNNGIEAAIRNTVSATGADGATLSPQKAYYWGPQGSSSSLQPTAVVQTTEEGYRISLVARNVSSYQDNVVESTSLTIIKVGP